MLVRDISGHENYAKGSREQNLAPGNEIYISSSLKIETWTSGAWQLLVSTWYKAREEKGL